MNNNLRVQICSDLDYGRLIAEIYRGDEYIALVSQEAEDANFLVEFPSANTPQKVEFDWLIEALRLAKEKLVGDVSLVSG